MTTTEQDTVIDLWNHRLYDRSYGYDNKVVEADNKILYVKIPFEGQSQPNIEYFRINDSLFHCIEYYQDSSYKAIGNYILGRKITGIDTLITQDLITGNFTNKAVNYRQILKTGQWTEYDNHKEFGDCWEGLYSQGKRIGIWKQINYGIEDKFELKQINYNADSTKVIYEKNIFVTLPSDSITKLLNGRWRLRSCDNEKSIRMIYLKCKSYSGHYGDDCNDRISKNNYYDFLTNNKFNRQRGEGCYVFRETSIMGDWKVMKEGADTFLMISFTDSKENWKLKIIYLDYDGNLITERQ